MVIDFGPVLGYHGLISPGNCPLSATLPPEPRPTNSRSAGLDTRAGSSSSLGPGREESAATTFIGERAEHPCEPHIAVDRRGSITPPLWLRNARKRRSTLSG